MKINIFDYIYPPKCVHCGAYLREPAALCGSCRALWEREKNAACKVCGKAHSGCVCNIHLAPYDKNARGAAGSMVLKIKNRGHVHINKFLSAELAALIADRIKINENTVVVNVPRSVRKKREHGTDQTERLAELVSSALKIKYYGVLTNRGSVQQKLLKAEDRFINAENAYGVKAKKIGKIAGKEIILLDDVITTGATAAKCRELLLNAGAADVTPVSVCVTSND